MMLLIEIPNEKKDVGVLIESLHDNEYSIVRPKFIDGTEIIQIFVELTKMTIPPLVTYFIGRKAKGNLTLKYNGKVELELTASISKKEVSEHELTTYFLNLVDKIESEDKK